LYKKIMFTVFGFYKFKKIKNLKKFKNLFESELSINKVRGTIILSSEGINGTLSGKKNSIQKIAKLIKKKIRFIKFNSNNYSLSRFQPFHREKSKNKKRGYSYRIKK
jgi:Predicted sulfurtransferase